MPATTDPPRGPAAPLPDAVASRRRQAVPPRGPGDAPGGPLRRLGWFVLLWALGVGVTGAVGLLIRTALMP